LLEVLHAVQQRLGYVPREAIAAIAHALNLSRAEVHGVVTFYHHFRDAPAGRDRLALCRAEACQAAGGRQLQAHAERRLGVACGSTTADGQTTLDAVYCLGLCACAPAVMFNGELLGRVTPERLDALLKGRT
jgi:formate dehydrogenase subunit gamma